MNTWGVRALLEILKLGWAPGPRIGPTNGRKGADWIEQAGVRRDSSLPSVEYRKASQVDVFGKVLRQKLLASDSPLAKGHLNILADEIVVQDKTATVRGSYAALAETMQAMQKAKVGNLYEQVPTFNLNWCARRDSNS